MKRYLALFLAVLMVCSLVACGEKDEEREQIDPEALFSANDNAGEKKADDHTETEPDAEENDTETKTVIEVPGEGEVVIENYELKSQEDGTTVIAFTFSFKNTHPTDELCFNDVASQSEEIGFYQNGEKLNPKHIDETNNISLEIQPGYTIKDIVKAYTLLDTVTDVEVGVEQEDGSVLFVQTLPIA